METCIFKDPFSLHVVSLCGEGTGQGGMEVPRLWGQRKERGRREDAVGSLGRLAPREERLQFRGLGWGQGFCKMAISKLGRVNPFSVWGEATVLQLSQYSNIGSCVTLENSLCLSVPEDTYQAMVIIIITPSRAGMRYP